MEVPGEDPETSFEAKTAHQAGGTDVDGHEAEPTVDLVQTEVVDANHLAAVDVDDLLVHEISAQEDLVGPLLELLDVDPGRGELSAGSVERPDGAPWQEDQAAIGLDHQARHGRVLVLDRNDEVRDLANLLVVPISNRPADRFAQVEHPGPPAELVHRAQSRRDGELCMRRAGAGPKRHQTASYSIVATWGPPARTASMTRPRGGWAFRLSSPSW